MPSLKTFFLLFFAILKHFYTLFKKKTGSLDAPRLDARAVAPPHTPLHAIASGHVRTANIGEVAGVTMLNVDDCYW